MTIEVVYAKAHTTFPKNYSYLVFDTDSKDGAVIDPAWDLTQMESLISDHDVDLSEILLTHHHPDHVGLADIMSVEYDVPVLMHKAEIRFYSFSCPNLYAVDEDTHISLGQNEVIPIHTPGHTKGSTCYLIGDNLFTGDTLFIEGCGLCFGRGADPIEMFDSLRKLKSLISLQTIVYPGHSYDQCVGKRFDYVMQNNIYLQLDKQDHFVSFRMRSNQYNLFDFK